MSWTRERQEQALKSVKREAFKARSETFPYFSHSLGKVIRSAEHYVTEMRRGGYVPYDLAQEWAEEYDKEHPRKPYELSAKAMDVIKSLRLTADRHGNIKLGSRAIEALQDIGAIPSQEVQDHIMQHMPNGQPPF